MNVDHSRWKPRCGLVWIPHISVGLIVEEHDSETGLCWQQAVVEMYQLVYIYVWRPHIIIRMGRMCRVCILSYVLPSVCIWDMAVRSAWLARLGPAWLCFGLLSAAFGLLFAVFPVSSGLLGGFLRLFAGFILRESSILMDYFAMEISVDSKIWKQQGIW
jgi:hypothetical protein